jgi:hypothetical protein
VAQKVDAVETTKRRSKSKAGPQRRRSKGFDPGYLYFPVTCDTEFQTVPHPDKGWFHDAVLEAVKRLGRGSIPLTIQFKGITEEAKPEIYLHPDYRRAFPDAQPERLKEAPEPVADYLNGLVQEGIEFEWRGSINDERYVAVGATRRLRIQFFAHFALAELHRIWGDRRIVDYIKKHCRPDPDAKREEPSFEMGRRLRTSVKTATNPVPSRWFPIPIIVTIGKRRFALEFDFYDSSGMLGNARSYQQFMGCSGIELRAKDNYTKDHKEHMWLQLIACLDRKGYESGAYRDYLPTTFDIDKETTIAKDSSPDTFVDYAIGDVEDLHAGILGVRDKFQTIYRELNLERYFTPPKPTTGSTVHEIIRASVYSLFESAFAGVDEFLTKGDKQLLEKAEINGFGSLTEKQMAAFPYWYVADQPNQYLPSKFQKDIEEHGFAPAMAERIATKKYWSGINAKVLGGRCVNSAPTLISQLLKPIADVDLKGCYVAAMMTQLFPIGRPIIIGEKFSRDSKRNHFPKLKDFLKTVEPELVPSLWQAWISVEDKNGELIDLPCDQDYFPSWKAPVSFFDYDKDEEGVWLERTDQVRHYKRAIFNTPLTHDGLQWLRLVASKELRDFIMENAVVKTAMYYPASQRKSNPNAWVRGRIAHEQNTDNVNTCVVEVNKKGVLEVVDKNREYYGWYAVNLGDLIAKKLKSKRNEWRVVSDAYKVLRAKKIRSPKDLEKLDRLDRKKIDRVLNSDTLGTYPGGIETLIDESRIYKKHPLDELFKLCGNTVYGVVVSRFFTLSNPVVGNNITARCRSIIALYQGACKGWNAITDGGLMRLDQVFYPRNNRFLNHRANLLVEGTAREFHDNHMRCAPIGGYDQIKWDGEFLVFVKDGKETRFHKSDPRKEDGSGYLDLIDDLILEHVRLCYPDGLDVLAPNSPFTFETKGVVESAAIHGAGNYYLEGGNHGEGYGDGPDNMVKMRSYSSNIHDKILRPFFLQLLHNPEKLDRTQHSQVFISSKILKPAAFSEQYHSYYQHTDLEPGDTIYEARMFREIGLTGFMFNNPAEEKSYRHFHEFNRQVKAESPSIGQSWEGFYLDDEGWYNYKQSVIDMEGNIRKNQPVPDKAPAPHHNTVTLQQIRSSLRKMMLKDPGVKLDPYNDPILDREVSAADIAGLEMLYQEIPDEAWF